MKKNMMMADLRELDKVEELRPLSVDEKRDSHCKAGQAVFDGRNQLETKTSSFMALRRRQEF